jgi:hypothetical protein
MITRANKSGSNTLKKASNDTRLLVVLEKSVQQKSGGEI